MFSLIITIISISLVAVLAVATIFYGGDALTRGQANSRAASLVAGAQQVAAAYKLHQTVNGKVAVNAHELVSEGVLSAVPAEFAGDNGVDYSIRPLSDFSADMRPFAYLVHLPEDLTLEECQAVDRLAGRTPMPDAADYPMATTTPPTGFNGYDHFNEFGCYQGESLTFYYKL